MDRPNKPAALSATGGKPDPQAQVTISQASSLVTAVLPTGDSVEVLLYGATVVSWKDASGQEKLFVSTAAKTDGSKPVRGGIPLVFPVFGAPPKDHATAKLPQHGFARNSRWEFLGKAGDGESESGSVKLDFGLSSGQLDQAWKDKWPYDFGLVYSVTLSPGKLATSLVVSNEGEEAFECQVLMHTYFRVNVGFKFLFPASSSALSFTLDCLTNLIALQQDIADTKVTGLDSASYIDKMDGAKVKTQAAGGISLSALTDCVYTPDTPPSDPIAIVEGGKTTLSISRDNMADVVVWNPWEEGAKGMGDFEPKDGWKNMICVEAGSVRSWTKLERGDVWEGAQTMTAS